MTLYMRAPQRNWNGRAEEVGRMNISSLVFQNTVNKWSMLLETVSWDLKLRVESTLSNTMRGVKEMQRVVLKVGVKLLTKHLSLSW